MPYFTPLKFLHASTGQENKKDGKISEITEHSAVLDIGKNTAARTRTSRKGIPLKQGAEHSPVSRAMPVFYNPYMKLNRDTAILLLSAWERDRLQVALPLAASGVRGIRMLKELPSSKIKALAFNDASPEAYARIQHNLKRNKFPRFDASPAYRPSRKKITVTNQDASRFLLDSTGFDYIDLDPFGSPVLFLDAALSRMARGGMLAVTATDTAALAGSSPCACLRRYGARPLRGELMHEIGLRILIGHIQRIAALHERAARPVFSYAQRHYIRAVFLCEKSKKEADSILQHQGYLLYCPSCGQREPAAHVFNIQECSICKKNRVWAGPLWLGNLWEKTFVARMLFSAESGYSSLLSFLSLIHQEAGIEVTGFYDIHQLAKNNHLLRIPKKDTLISAIKKQGYCASETHFNSKALRTTMPLQLLQKLIRDH